MEALKREYKRYILYKDLASLHNYDKYLSKLEKFILFTALDKTVERTDAIYPRLDIDFKYLSLFDDNSESSQKRIKKLKSNIVRRVNQFLDDNEEIELDYGVIDDLYFCNDFRKYLNTDIKNALKKRYKNADFTEKLLMVMLRYSSMGFFGKFWTMNDDVYKWMYDEGIRVEGMSDPLTSRMILFGDDTKFYTLFPDTDRYFGGIKDFFDLKEIEEDMILVPPNCDEIYVEVLKKVHNTKNKVYLFLTNYHEFDMPHHHFEKNTYIFQNVSNGRIILPFRFYSNADLYFLNCKIDKELIRKCDRKDTKKSNRFTKKLDKEYTRYQHVLKISRLIKENRHEWMNILERLLIAFANLPEHPHDEIFVDIPSSHSIFKKFKSECAEKKIYGSEYLVEKIRNIMRSFLELDKYEHVVFDREGHDVNLNGITIKINEKRRICMIDRLVDNIEYLENYEEIICCAYLRYMCILNRGNNWNIPYDIYLYLNRFLGLNFEGFSSPVNSQSIVLGNKNINFCSVFYDTDKYFGSNGSLFEYDFEGNYEELSITMFPPNVPSVMEEMLKLIKRLLKNIKKCRIFVSIPDWEDYFVVKELKESKYLKFLRSYEGGEYYFENSLENKIKTITPNQTQLLYVLSNVEENIDYSNFSNAFVV